MIKILIRYDKDESDEQKVANFLRDLEYFPEDNTSQPPIQKLKVLLDELYIIVENNGLSGIYVDELKKIRNEASNISKLKDQFNISPSESSLQIGKLLNRTENLKTILQIEESSIKGISSSSDKLDEKTYIDQELIWSQSLPVSVGDLALNALIFYSESPINHTWVESIIPKECWHLFNLGNHYIGILFEKAPTTLHFLTRITDPEHSQIICDISSRSDHEIRRWIPVIVLNFTFVRFASSGDNIIAYPHIYSSITTVQSPVRYEVPSPKYVPFRNHKLNNKKTSNTERWSR
eukprot:NODE_5326_length_1030_cov_22.272326_g4758_i0.p1 GENE.NODE_5326_length_1030_cov_22.272326_g4758_i0~~NODE_5326_length_1030_cov_22.272326_g4758_i0.p1  ORF type:complete len:309 (+),score=52.51 NODE_5326_length_1030_cov_22.272326_g4758_i0:54-929(+)